MVALLVTMLQCAKESRNISLDENSATQIFFFDFTSVV
jgi:hypothetical protein